MQTIPNSQLVKLNTIEYKEFGNGIERMLYRIDTPIVIIFGLGENTEKFDVQVSINKKLAKRGYKVAGITTRRDSEMVGLYSAPNILFDQERKMREKILAYNHYVKQIETSERPDIFTISVPGGVVPFDEYTDYNFGEMAYMISYAVPCDAAIMCINYISEYNENLEELKRSIYEKFGWNVIMCHMSRVSQDLMSYLEEHVMKYISVGNKLYDEKIKKLKEKNIYNLLDERAAHFG